MLYSLLTALLILLFNNSWAHDKPTAITLSPHLTELVYSAGGQDQLIGVSAYSDYPEAAKQKPIIGDAFRLDLESLYQLQPDVIFYWVNGTSAQSLEQLKTLDAKLVAIATPNLSDIPKAIQTIATTLNTQPAVDLNAFDQQLKSLRLKPRHTALMQISDQPIYTVDASHWMSEAMAVCGLSNVFKKLATPSAAVTLESVVAQNPEALVRIAPNTERNPLLRWPKLEAIKEQRIATLNPDHFTRPTLRILQGIASLCDQVKQWPE